MATSQPHRKRVRHYDLPGHSHELTFSCFCRLPLLTDDSRREMLARAIDAATERCGWQLAAFVFMPEPVHLVIHPGGNATTIQKLLFAVKRPFSYRVKQELISAGSQFLEKLTVRQRPGVQTFRFWQEGPGYDRNLTTAKAILNSIDYVHANPMRRGLCRLAADRRWSSAKWYETDGQEIDATLPRLTPLPAGSFYEGTMGEII